MRNMIKASLLLAAAAVMICGCRDSTVREYAAFEDGGAKEYETSEESIAGEYEISEEKNGGEYQASGGLEDDGYGTNNMGKS